MDSHSAATSTLLPRSVDVEEESDRPRLVCLVTDSVSTRLLTGQLRFLKEQGFDPTLVCNGGPDLQVWAEKEGIRVRTVTMSRAIRLRRDILSLAGVIVTLRNLKPHIVSAGTPKAALLGMIAAWLLRVPVRVHLVRGLRLETTAGWMRRILSWTERIAARCATHSVFISRSLQEVYLELGLGAAGKSVVLLEGSSNGVCIDRFRATEVRRQCAMALRHKLGIPEDAPVIGFVGRITRDKGANELVAAFQRVRERHPGVHLLLVGRVEAEDSPAAWTLERIEADPAIHSTGVLEDPADAFHVMDFLVLPSYREGFGNVVLEAASAGRPTIGFRATGVIDAVVDGETGVLVPVGSVDELAAAMEAYLRDPVLVRNHGMKALARVEEKFTQEKVFRAISDFYAEALRDVHGQATGGGFALDPGS